MKTVFLFGGTGSLGTATVDAWKDKDGKFVLFSRDEGKHWRVKTTFPNVKIESYIGDIACYEQVKDALLTHLPDTIIVMSAMKHIDYCEKFIESCMKTNVTGIANVLRVVREHTWSTLKKVCFVSTDKACSPVNVYGMSKSIAERMIRCPSPVPIVAVRYGNVLNSSGSVIPVFQKQSTNPQTTHITVTDPGMTRFVIDMREAIQLIEDALEVGAHGEVFIPVLSSMRILDIAKIFSRESGKPIRYTGMREGEKLHESLYSSQERPYISRIGSRYVLRQTPSLDMSLPPTYDSDSVLIEEKYIGTRIAPYLPMKLLSPKIAIFGATGMLGRCVEKYLSQKGYDTFPITRSTFEVLITDDKDTLREEIEDILPKDCTAVINCLGLTNKRKVGDALFYIVNGCFPVVLSEICEKRNVTVVHASTDCVFSGLESPYTESNFTDSRDVYGQSKRQGELHSWTSIIRTSIVGEGGKGDDLLEWFRKEEGVVQGYTNHGWNGITCLEWAKLAEQVVRCPYRGILHVDTGYVYTKYQLLKLIDTVYGLNKAIVPVEVERNYKILISEHGKVFSVPPLEEQLREQKKFWKN